MKGVIRTEPVTLKDIANIVGMDTSTISRAINHPDKVKPATLTKINKCIEELNYHPNMIARGLQTAKSNLIALVVPNFTNLGFANIAKGFHDSLKGTEYELIICSSMEDPDEELKISKSLVRQRVGGVVFVGTVSTTEKQIPYHIFKNNTNVLVIDQEVEDDFINVFLLDAHHGIKIALSHLLALGHRQIAIITGNEYALLAKSRIDLIKSILEELKIDIPKQYIREGDWTASGAWHAMEDLLNLTPRPTAVFAITDTMAMGAMGAANNAGLKVPEDISIIGFNNELGSESFSTPLTTIGPHAYDIGIHAGKLILSQFNERAANRVVKKFPLDLIIRKSTAPPPRTDTETADQAE